MNDSNINQYVFQNTLSNFPRSVQFSAKTLFDKLDPDLEPQIALVAVPFEGEDITLVCTDGIDYKSEWFIDVKNILRQIPDSYLDSLAADIQGVLWQHKVEILELVRKVLDERCIEKGYRSFTIFPEFMHGYSVSVILQLYGKALQSHYALSRNAIRPHPKETSLIHEAIVHFLYECLNPLKKISEGIASSYLRDHGNEALRQAGYWLMKTPEKASGDHGPVGLFHACNVISSLRYEGSESLGRMILSTKDHPNVETSIHLQNVISLNNYRGIRKLLEISSNEMYLLCHSKGVYGVGKLKNISYDENAENLFVIEFTNHHTWVLKHSEHKMMVVEYGLPNLPSEPIGKKDFQDQTRIIFPQFSEEHLSSLWSIADRASKQKHGTMLVITDHAEQEAERLKNQSTSIRPVQLTPELILPLSSIDGALLVDPTAKCYSIGVILDGIATKKGDPSRGARFNSAIRYLDLVSKQKHQCLIVVISEDGMINLMSI